MIVYEKKASYSGGKTKYWFYQKDRNLQQNKNMNELLIWNNAIVKDKKINHCYG